MAAHNIVDNNDTCIPNVTSMISTNFSDSNPSNVKVDTVNSPLLFGVTVTSCTSFVSFIIGAIVIGLLVVTCASKRQLQLELRQLKETVNPIYEDIDLNTNRNVAYDMPDTAGINGI